MHSREKQELPLVESLTPREEEILIRLGDGKLDVSNRADAVACARSRALQSAIEFGSMTPVMYSLPVAALLTANEGQTERAIELYGAARRELDLWQTASELIEEMTGTA